MSVAWFKYICITLSIWPPICSRFHQMNPPSFGSASHSHLSEIIRSNINRKQSSNIKVSQAHEHARTMVPAPTRVHAQTRLVRHHPHTSPYQNAKRHVGHRFVATQRKSRCNTEQFLLARETAHAQTIVLLFCAHTPPARCCVSGVPNYSGSACTHAFLWCVGLHGSLTNLAFFFFFAEA